jgi:hypothetical protein
VSASFQYQTSQSVQIGFDTPMDPNTIAATDLVLHPTAGGSDVIPSGVSYDVSTRIATFTFAAPIPDGDFTATLASASVSDAGSDALAGGFSFDLFILRGDANHDGTVNTADFNLVATNFNSTGTTWGQGDFNYDGKVNALDFNVLATKYGATLPAPPLSAAAQLSAPAKASAPLDLFGSASIQPVDRNLLDVLSPENSDSQASIPD